MTHPAASATAGGMFSARWQQIAADLFPQPRGELRGDRGPDGFGVRVVIGDHPPHVVPESQTTGKPPEPSRPAGKPDAGPSVNEIVLAYVRFARGYYAAKDGTPTSDSGRKPRRAPGQRCTTESYRRAIARGCELAGVAPWSPHKLRHAANFLANPWRRTGVNPRFAAATDDARRIVEFAVGRFVGLDELAEVADRLGQDGPRKVAEDGRTCLERSAADVVTLVQLGK